MRIHKNEQFKKKRGNLCKLKSFSSLCVCSPISVYSKLFCAATHHDSKFRFYQTPPSYLCACCDRYLVATHSLEFTESYLEKIVIIFFLNLINFLLITFCIENALRSSIVLWPFYYYKISFNFLLLYIPYLITSSVI